MNATSLATFVQMPDGFPTPMLHQIFIRPRCHSVALMQLQRDRLFKRTQLQLGGATSRGQQEPVE
jgi:hypothetical protein